MSDLFPEGIGYEDHPNVIAYDVDGDFCPVRAGTEAIDAIDLIMIGDEIGERGETFELSVQFAAGSRVVKLDPYVDFSSLMNEIDGVIDLDDSDPEAGSSVHVFCVEDGADVAAVEYDIGRLAAALRAEFADA